MVNMENPSAFDKEVMEFLKDVTPERLTKRGI
jgi:hypothetical protein